MRPQKIEISYKTIVFTAFFLIALFILWSLRSILLILFVCFIFSESLNPTVTMLQKLKIPRPLAIFLIYLAIVSTFSFAIAGVVPGLVEQTTGLIETLPRTISGINVFGLKAIDIYSQFKILDSLPSSVAKATISLFSDIFTGFVVLVITFYMLLEKKNYHTYAKSVFGSKGGEKAEMILTEIENRMGRWVNAELLLMTTIGALSYLGYVILGINYALPLAVIAGLLEAVPNIGPTIAAVVAAVVGLSISPLTAVLAIIWGIVVQQLENNLIVPKIMNDRVGLKPIVTIVLIAAGAKLAGIVGALLAVPMFLTVEVIIRNLLKK